MRNHTLTLLLFYCFVFNLLAQSPPEVAWDKTFIPNNGTTPKEVIQTWDGGYLVIGEYLDDSFDEIKIIKKFDADGVEKWTSNFQFGIDWESSISQIIEVDDGFVFVGTTSLNPSTDILLGKISKADGSETDSNSYDLGSLNDDGLTLIEDSAGNLLVGGTGSGNAWLLKLTSEGGFIDDKTSDNNFLWGNRIDKILESGDGNYYLFGTIEPLILPFCNETNTNYINLWMCKINPDLNILWSKSIGNSGADLFMDAAVSNTGDPVILGRTGCAGDPAGPQDVGEGYWVSKLDGRSGTYEWSKLLTGTPGISPPFEFRGITINCENEIVITGGDAPGVEQSRKIGALKLDQCGDESLWNDRFFFSPDIMKNYLGWDIKATNDNGYIVLGSTQNLVGPINDSKSFILIKLEPDPLISCNEQNVCPQPTICELGGPFISQGNTLSGEWEADEIAPPGFLDADCVECLFTIEGTCALPDPLYADFYIFYHDGLAVGEDFLDIFTSDSGHKVALFSCDDCGLQDNDPLPCGKHCIYSGDYISIPLADLDPGFYHLAVVSTSPGPYELSIFPDREDLCAKFIENVITCETIDPLEGTFTDPDDSSFDRLSAYSGCLDGGSLYDGPDLLFQFTVDKAQEVEFILSSTNSDDLGLFLFNNRCGENCFNFTEIPNVGGAGGTTSLKVELLPDIYFLILDVSTPPPGTVNYNLQIICSDFTPQVYVINDCPTQETQNRHTVSIDDPINDFLQDGDLISFFYSLNNNQLTTSDWGQYVWNSAMPAQNLYLEQDISGDSDKCAYEEMEPLRVRYTPLDNINHSIELVPAYDPGNPSEFTQNESSFISDLQAGELNNFQVTPSGNAIESAFTHVLTVFITSTTSWEVKLGPGGEWLTLPDPLGGDEGTTFYTINIPENPSNECRIANLEFISNNGSIRRLNIRQAPECPEGPLQVELISLEAHPVDNNFIRLKWETSSEINNEGFEIQRSYNGRNFKAIDWVNGNHHSSTIREYVYNDYKVAKNVDYYYRLKQVDHDGKYELSNTVQARLKTDGSVFEIYPNPVQDRINIYYQSSHTGRLNYQLLNTLGQKVLQGAWQDQAKQGIIEIEVSSLPPGVYFVNLQAASERESKKVVLR